MDQNHWEVRTFEDEELGCPFIKWLSSLDAVTQLRIDARLDRIKQGNLGDHKSIGEELYELRLFFGPGYRIYYTIVGKQIVLLLAGGSKKRQSRDIKLARALWNRYQSQA